MLFDHFSIGSFGPIDVMPTCLEIAGGTYPKTYRGRDIIPVEGKSLVPVFQGGQRRGHPALFWELYGHRAVRKGPWKLVALRERDWELYDIENDRGETNNLADQHPDIVTQLSALHHVWSQRCKPDSDSTVR